MSEEARRHVRRLAVALVALNLLLPLGLVVYAKIIGRDYWYMFWGEYNAITWFSSAQLLLVAGAAYANHQVELLLRQLRPPGWSRTPWVLLVFALGFAFLAIDERFELHEALRDEVLIPADAFSGIPFVRPGDVALYVYLGVGLVLTAFLIDELRRCRRALTLFVGAVALAVPITIIDAVPRSVERTLPYFWTSAFEEVGEIWVQLLFLLSFLVLLSARLKELGGASSAATEP